MNENEDATLGVVATDNLCLPPLDSCTEEEVLAAVRSLEEAWANEVIAEIGSPVSDGAAPICDIRLYHQEETSAGAAFGPPHFMHSIMVSTVVILMAI